jgi:eukaryotic-like serine/threonine-protein kinase
MTLTASQILQARYRVINLLALGGCGAVYQGWDSNLSKPVAIKENLDTSPEAQRQFQQEARILSSLSHPNLPRVTDHFFIPRLGQYLVMDFVEGEDLQAMLNRLQHPLPEAPVLAWIIQVCDALEYLHAQNPPVIHRDIKPANIKISPQGKAVLVDFGISKIYDPNLKTMVGARAVTPPYSPPEQYGTGITDPRSDIYALGATLYTLLTGQEPPESVDRVSNGLSLTPPRQLSPALSLQIDAAIVRACELNKAERYQTAQDFRLALQPQPQAGSLLARYGRLWSTVAGIVAIITALIFIGLLLSNPVAVLAPLSATYTLRPAPTSAPSRILETAIPRSLPTVLPSPTVSPSPTVPPSLTASPSPTASSTPGLGSTQMSDKDGMTLLYVPGGQFIMGSNGGDNDEKPPHEVTLSAFWIDRTEVTNAMFKRFVDDTGYKTDAEKIGTGYVFDPAARLWNPTNDTDWQHPLGPSSNLSGLDTHPVVQVSWNDAKAYCEWAGRRLPTEAEWERVARGTDGRSYPWGNQEVAGNLLNFADRNLEVDWADKNVNDGYRFTAPVGQYPDGASPYGALDMAGNVWEWVADWYGEAYYASSPDRDPAGATTGNVRIFRGGGWNDGAANVRAADRYGLSPDGRGHNGGFRCAR